MESIRDDLITTFLQNKTKDAQIDNLNKPNRKTSLLNYILVIN